MSNCVAKKLYHVFVYGTLKKGEPNHHYFTTKTNGFAQYVCDGKTIEKFPLIVATKYNVPFLLNVPNMGHNISGEIYSIDETMFGHLDELEDYPTLYDRHIFNVNGSDGKTYKCWIYMLKEYPRDYLQKYEFQSEYRDSVEKPYQETYVNSCTPDDIYDSEN